MQCWNKHHALLKTDQKTDRWQKENRQRGKTRTKEKENILKIKPNEPC